MIVVYRPDPPVCNFDRECREIVELRATAKGHGYVRKFPLGKGAIIEIGAAPVKSAAKGSKIYKVLPLGSAETVEIEERHIKKARGV